MSPAMTTLVENAIIDHKIMCSINIEEVPVTLRDVDAMGRDGKPSKPTGKPPARRIGARRYRLARGVTVDSGAADNVMPRRLLRGRAKVRPSEASRAGVHYVAANDGRIRNEGEADLDFMSKEGHEHSWTFQIAEVNKVLASVSHLVDTNHRVTFEKDDKTGVDLSFIVDKHTGVSTRMRRDRNVWVVDAWIEEDGVDPDAVFARQE